MSNNRYYICAVPTLMHNNIISKQSKPPSLYHKITIYIRNKLADVLI